ncbi:proline-rich protein 29-like [Genypterus blacodes]|uniref:proline-rich protein 29-like n=1 Tax=Genypterus blacodes TaxID=154954 RepID=UPI003F774350
MRNGKGVPYLPQAPQQPTTILQQLPASTMPPGGAGSIRPGGHVREELMELMMIQNAQMHQVIMNNMTLSALGAFGYSGPQPASTALSDHQLIVEDHEDDAEVYHHYYPPAPSLPPPAWLLYHPLPQPAAAPSHTQRPAAVPPPPPPGSSGTASPPVPPAAGKLQLSNTQPAAN